MNVRQRKSERHKETLRKLSQDGRNKCCFDCGIRGPLYVVSNFGILVCSGCSAVHRSFQHKVKGITMSEFTDDEIARFALAGNDRAQSVWLSTFSGQLPRPGDVVALKRHVRITFEERQYWNAQEFAALEESWEHPNEPTPQTLHPSSVAKPAAFALPPPSEAPAAAPRLISAATTRATPSSTAAPPQSATSPQPAQKPQENILDDLFAPPVQSPPLLQFTAHTAVAGAPPISASYAPAPSPPQQQQQQRQATVSSIVDDLFGGVSQPVMTSFSGYGVNNFAGGPPTNAILHPQLHPSQPPYPLPQTNQPSIPYAASSQMEFPPSVGGHQTIIHDFSSPFAPSGNP